MDKLKIFVISGKAQHGKDTVANILRDDLSDRGYKVLVTHYADLVKYICKTFFHWDGEKDERGRALLQYVGTDVVRNQNPNYWVDFIVDILKMFGHNWDYVIIPDARFPNEITALTDNFDDVKHIRVVRPNFKSNLTEEQLNHPSETSLDSTLPDFIFENEGTVEELKRVIQEWKFS